MRVDIYIACPICIDEFWQCSKEYWRHEGSCNGILQLDEKANVVCSRCGRSAHITQMRLTCNSGRHTFAVPTVTGYAQAISMAAMGVSSASTAWLQSVLMYIQRNY